MGVASTPTLLDDGYVTSFGSLGPLETYYNLLNLKYSLLTFLQGVEGLNLDMRPIGRGTLYSESNRQ